MLPAGGALVLASTACAQIALEPRGRVPAVTPAGYGRPSHACAVVPGIRHRCWASSRDREHPAPATGVVLGRVMVVELSAESVPAGQHRRRRGRGAVELRGHIPQSGQVAAQRRVQGAHEADVGLCVRLARTVAGSHTDRARYDRRCPRYRGEVSALTPHDLV